MSYSLDLEILIEEQKRVDRRLGNPTGRIKSIYELEKLYNKNIYIVISPFGSDKININNCFLWDWKVGDIVDQDMNHIDINDSFKLDLSKRFLCLTHKYNAYDENIEYISLKDINIIPNDYNNNCAFESKEMAKSYILYRKLKFSEDNALSILENKYKSCFDIKKIITFLKKT